MPVSKKMFFMHRLEFSSMMKAVKEIEAMNRADITMVITANESLLKLIKENKDAVVLEDVMYE